MVAELLPGPILRGGGEEGNHVRHKSCDRSLLRRALTFWPAMQQKNRVRLFFSQRTRPHFPCWKRLLLIY